MHAFLNPLQLETVIRTTIAWDEFYDTLVLVSTQVVPLLTILLTVVAATWVVHTVEPDIAMLHGILVGGIVAGISLPLGALDLIMLVRFVLTILAGGLGAGLGSRGQGNQSRSAE